MTEEKSGETGEYAAAMRAWEEWKKSRMALVVSAQPLRNSFPVFLESNWAWASFKSGWDASRRARNEILKVDELGRKKTI